MTPRSVFGVVLSTLLTFLLMGTPTPGRAQDELPTRVQLLLPSCEELGEDLATLRELLEVELTADGVDEVAFEASEGDGDPAPSDRTLSRISVTATPCESGATRFAITIDDDATQKSVQRLVDLASVDSSARPRALSLTIAELLRATWAELARPDSPSSLGDVPHAVREAVRVRLGLDARDEGEAEATDAALDAPEPSPAPVAPPRSRLGWGVDAGVFVSTFVGARTALLGARVGGSVSLGSGSLGSGSLGAEPRLRASIAADIATGTSLDRLGRIDVTLATGSIAVEAVVGSSPALAVGPRLALGWVRTAGEPYSDDTVTASGSDLAVLLGATAELSAGLTDWMAVFLELDLGGVLTGLRARSDGRDVAGVDGAWLAARTGLRIGAD